MIATRACSPPASATKRSRTSLPGLLSSAPPIGITGPWQICLVGADATGADRSWASLMSYSCDRSHGTMSALTPGSAVEGVPKTPCWNRQSTDRAGVDGTTDRLTAEELASY